MNNMMFALTRYLRDRGHHAELLIYKDEFSHFHPSMDSFDNDFESFTKVIDWSNLPSKLYATSKKSILETISSYDLLIGCGSSPAYVHKAGTRLDVMFPYGSDIDRMPFFNLSRAPFRKIWKYYQLSRLQKQGIENSRYIILSHSNEEWEKTFASLDISHKRIMAPCPFLYLPQYEGYEKYRPVSEYYERFKVIRESCDLMIFAHARHEWHSYDRSDVSHKGNDQLLKGFASLVNSRKDINAKLVLFEYGTDVRHSKKLIAELGINEYVHWLPIAPRKEIMMGLSMADVGIGNLSNSFLIYGVVGEFMAAGVPIIHNRNVSLYTDFEELYPMINGSSAEDVRKGLELIYEYPLKYKQVGQEAKDWFLKYMVNQPLDLLEELLHIQRIPESVT